MTQVQIDDFNCEICEKLTMANLDMKTGKYNCLVCNGKTEFEKLQEENEKLREEITEMIKFSTPLSKIWIKINELVENELQQEGECE